MKLRTKLQHSKKIFNQYSVKLLIKNSDNQFIMSFSSNELKNFQDISEELHFSKGKLTANIVIPDQIINSQELSDLKINLEKLNIKLSKVYTSNRETLITAKSLKIESNFLKEKDLKNESSFINSPKKQNHIFQKGTVRSGDRISSNGHLFIVGDVNPGAIVSARENVYIWGKLLGIAFAGESGNKNASISSLYLNPLQLRIAGIIAIGPKEKPKNHYPETALIENDSIIIRPFIIKA